MPTAGPLGEGLWPGRDRFIGDQALDVFGQGARRGVAIERASRHRLQADRLERRGNVGNELPGSLEVTLPNGVQNRANIVALERRSAGKQ